MLKIKIKLKSNSEGTLNFSGIGTIPCLGRYAENYPKGEFTISPMGDRYGQTLFEHYYSRTYSCGEVGVSCKMDYAIKLDGGRGIFIHAWPGNPTIKDNGGPSHGCIHLSYINAKRLFNLLKNYKKVHVQIYK